MKPPPLIRRGLPRGFTLMELMLVLGIITLLIVVGMRIGPPVMRAAKVSTTKAGVGTLRSSVEYYQNSHGGRLPPNMQKLVESGAASEETTRDPWGNPFQYVIPAKRSKDKFDVYSMGPDEIDGTADDVGNWDAE